MESNLCCCKDCWYYGPWDGITHAVDDGFGWGDCALARQEVGARMLACMYDDRLGDWFWGDDDAALAVREDHYCPYWRLEQMEGEENV